MRFTLLFITAIITSLSGCHLRARSKVSEHVIFHDDLNYGAIEPKDSRHGFDLYLPRERSVPRAAVIFVHGGYWRNQSRSYHKIFTGLYQNFGLALATRGLATAVIDYRLYPNARPEDQIADIESAVAYLAKNAQTYSVDSQKIFVVGHSAGAHLGLMAAWAKHNAAIKGVIALSPILDIGHMRQNKEADFNRELTVPFFGTGDTDAKHSPATYATAASTPALILYGEKDYSYLIEQSKVYKEKFATIGLAQIRFETIAGVDHSDIVLDVHTSDDKVSDRIAAFVGEIGGRK